MEEEFFPCVFARYLSFLFRITNTFPLLFSLPCILLVRILASIHKETSTLIVRNFRQAGKFSYGQRSGRLDVEALYHPHQSLCSHIPISIVPRSNFLFTSRRKIPMSRTYSLFFLFVRWSYSQREKNKKKVMKEKSIIAKKKKNISFFAIVVF